MRPLIDAHIDLAYNALSADRDLTLPLAAINAAEVGLTDDSSRRLATVCLPELRRARVALCFATLFARASPDPAKPKSIRTRLDADHASQSIAHAIAHGQLAYYQLLHRQSHARILASAAQLDAHWSAFLHDPDAAPLGILITMEGADPILDPDDLHRWHSLGLRAIGPAHFGRSRYAAGPPIDGPITTRGTELLRHMQLLRIILDITHLSDTSFHQALDLYTGPIIASHHNCRALAPTLRQLTDDQIRLLIQRDAIIGAALYNPMLAPHWKRGDPPVPLSRVADHIDHICQLASSTRHCVLGSDLDGGFGSDETPGIQSHTDIHQLVPILTARGYSNADLDAIFHANALRFLRQSLP